MVVATGLKRVRAFGRTSEQNNPWPNPAKLPEHEALGMNNNGTPKFGWIRLLVSMVRMSHLASWSLALDSTSTKAFGESRGEEDHALLAYYEIAVFIIEYLLEQDRRNRGVPVHLDDCINDLLFSKSVMAAYPGITEEAVLRVVATLSTPTAVPFRLLGDRVLKDPTAIIRKVEARGVDRYYLTETGLMLCGLSRSAEDIENLDLDMLRLTRILKNGDFEKFIQACEDEIVIIHKLSSELVKIAKEPSSSNQWIMTLAKSERVTKTLKGSWKHAMLSLKRLDSEKVSMRIDQAVERNPENVGLRSRLHSALSEVASALNGLRINFEELLKISQEKRHAFVPTIDFFRVAITQFQYGGLDDDLIDAHFDTFGLCTPQAGDPRTRRIWASASPIDFLTQIRRKNAAVESEDDMVAQPLPEEIEDVISGFDMMMQDHAISILEILDHQQVLKLSDYVFGEHTESIQDNHIPALYSLFVEPSVFELFDRTVASSVVNPLGIVEWKNEDGAKLLLTDLKLHLRSK